MNLAVKITRFVRALPRLPATASSVALSLIVVPPAQAELLTFTATGYVSGVNDFGNTLSSYFTTAVNIGDPYSFNYTFNTATLNTGSGSTGQYTNALTSASVSIGNNAPYQLQLTTADSGLNSITVSTATNQNWYAVRSSEPWSSNYIPNISAGITLTGGSNYFASTALPTLAPDASQFSNTEFRFTWGDPIISDITGTVSNISSLSAPPPPPPVTSQQVTLGPGLLPALPPTPTITAISALPPPSTLLSGGPNTILDASKSTSSQVAAWITDKVNAFQIMIGSNDVFYPSWLKDNADSVAIGIDTTVKGAWQLDIARDFGWTSITTSLGAAAKAALKDTALYTLAYSDSLSAHCSPFGIQTNCTGIFVDAFSVGSAGNPYLAALYGNLAVLGDFLAPALKQYGKDPLNPSYTQMFLPTAQLTVNLGLTGNQAFDQTTVLLLQSIYRTTLYLEAINQSYDRYSAAYAQGDGQSAVLQLEAILYYMDLFRNESAISAGLLKTIDQLAQELGISAIATIPSWLTSIQQELSLNGFSDELLALFRNIGLSDSEIDDLANMILAYSSSDFQSTGGFDPLDSTANLILFASGRSSAVPEGGTLMLVWIGVMALMIHSRRRRRGLF